MGFWRRLLGEPVPEVRLPFAPQGEHVGAMVSLSELARRRSLAVCFYRGGAGPDEDRSGQVLPEQRSHEDVRLEGWREHERDLAEFGYDVVAVSSQSAEAQAQCVWDRLPTASILFLSDTDLLLARELELPKAMRPEGNWVYEPLTLLVDGGCISWVFYPLEDQRFDAAIATEWVRRSRRHRA